MKIALIGPVYPYRGGIAHYTTMLDHALCQAGHTLLLVSFRRQYPRWLFPGESDQDPSASPLRANDPNYWLDSLNPFTWLATFRRIRRAAPDVLVLQWWTTFFAPLWITLGLLNGLLLRRPLVYICHNVLPHEAHFWDRWVARLTLRWGTRFIVQSAAEAERLRNLLGAVEVAVVPHPVYDFLANHPRSRHAARQRLNLPPDVPVVLFFGIVREYKGLDTLLNAWPRVLATTRTARLLIAGEFWEARATYAALISQLGIEYAVMIDDRYIPNEEVGVYFAAADLLAAPYRRVTDSGALQMAHGFGLPVVTGQMGLASDRDHRVDPEDIRVEKLAADILATIARSKEDAPPATSAPDAYATWRDLATAITTPVRAA